MVAPSAEAKASFLKEASKSLKKRPGAGRWIISLSVVFLAAVLGTFLFYTSGSFPETNPVEILQQARVTLTDSKNHKTSTLYIKSHKAFTGAAQVSPNQQTEQIINIKKRAQTVSEEMPSDSMLSSGSMAISQPVIPVINSDTITSVADFREMQIEKPDSASTDLNSTLKAVSKERWPEREWRISAGLYYAPEWMFNTLEGTKPATNFGVEGTFRIGRYSIRTGAGLSITKGTNQLAIEYKDYLGSYMKLDSMTFAWDKQHYYLVPTYFLTDKDVFDSLMRLDNAKVIKRYTYLQVPLILGYDFLRTGKFSIGVRLGPILSILLTSKKISGDYDPEKKQIISVNMITPEQINMNWQIMGGINATFRFSRRFGIELEPFGKYYLNSVYEFSGSSKPWSLGIRGAVFISF